MSTDARLRRRVRAGRPANWQQIPPAERDAHDWLYAVAKLLLDAGNVTAANLVMNFADAEVSPYVP